MRLSLAEDLDGDEVSEEVVVGDGGETASRSVGACLLVDSILSKRPEEGLMRKELWREGGGVDELRSSKAHAAYGWE